MDNRIKLIKEINERSGMNTNYVHPKDGSLKYWKYRILRPVLKLKYKWYRRSGDLPWLTQASIEFFQKYLDGTQVGCEFGSGVSTAFFSKGTKHFVSIEHYKPWYDKVQKELKEKNCNNIDYRFIEKQEPIDERTTQQMFPGISGVENYDYRKDFVNYFQALHDFEDEYFDFIIVDGRARPECVFASIPKLKSGGLMILDNSERERYSIVFENLTDWESANTTTGLTNTTFWVKPRS